jgi:Protein of unknown function (DUF1475)
MIVFRVLLAVAWLLLFYLTAVAIGTTGLKGVSIFFLDFSHPWRAQFYSDLTLDGILAAAWIAFREGTALRAALFALLAFACGGIFTLGYIFVATFRAHGDSRALLLGHRAAPTLTTKI